MVNLRTQNGFSGSFGHILLMLATALLMSRGTMESFAAEISESKFVSRVGQKIEEFRLHDFRGAEHSLGEYQDRKFLVVVFLGTDCPLAKLYGPRLAQLAAEFEPQQVAFLGINSNSQDSLAQIGNYVQKHGIKFPMLKDPNNAVADEFQARRTPEAYVLGPDRVIRYHGAIDNQYQVGIQRPKTTETYLASALKEMLAGNPVSRPAVENVGCLIGRIAKVKPHGDITYSQQISRILNKNCVECHRAGEIGPFPLTNYQEVVGWAAMIREVVQERRMPPWFAKPGVGKFSNDCQLSQAELQLISTWVANGTPEGDPKQLPEPPKYIAGWRIPKPDVVYYISDKAVQVPAEGVIEYRHFVVDPGFKEDMWVKAAEARPGNAAIVHHHVVYFVPPGKEGERGFEIKNQIAGYGPGTPPFQYAEGVAQRIPAGSKLVFQMHYTPNGSPQEDRSYVGLVFTDPKSVKQTLRSQMVAEFRFEIPPGAANHAVQATEEIDTETLLVNLQPHMHIRGKSFRVELENPDGQRETLLDVPRYDFNWQLRYDLAEPRVLRKGARLHAYATFDNSSSNPANPDPSKPVHFGEQTWEEMMVGIFQTIDLPSESEIDGVPGAILKSEREKFAGSWSAVAVEYDGENLDGDIAGRLSLVYNTDGNWTVTIDRNELMAGSWKVDPTKMPKEISYNLTNAPEGQKKSIGGIYEIDGDTLKVCAANESDTRPTEFLSRPGTGVSVIVFKRQKK
jgi:uncharacterized protein (TIGR03067 family)